MARLWAMTTTFESLQVGDRLPILVKWETEESIRRLNAQAAPVSVGGTGDGPQLSLHPAALVSYVTELLEKGFPAASLTARGSRLEVEHQTAVRPGDTISLSGQVVDKREEDGLRLVECRVLVEGQNGTTAARATAVVSL